jgi:predicted enzyme related to lactoylglutathione lyase
MNDTNPPLADKPIIAAPVSRSIAVADIDRTVAFYRDVLGFEVRPITGHSGIELTHGPASIHPSERAFAPDSTGTQRPKGAAIIFFQIADVIALHGLVSANGGQPSTPEKVNWIKMQVFQIDDPDGHTLWFGQSFQEPDRPKAPDQQMQRALPNLPASDVAASARHYQEVLGFTVNYIQNDLAVMDRDDITIILFAKTEAQTGLASCYVYVRDADTLYAELQSKGAKLSGGPTSHPWGLRDFHVRDLEGNRITFGQPFE